MKDDLRLAKPKAKMLEQLKPFFASQDQLEDKAYVLFIGNRLRRITWPDVVDKKGYNQADTWPVRDFLIVRDWEKYKLTNEQIEWLRRKLLKYKKQIDKLGLDFGRLERVKFSNKAIFWKRVISDSRFAKSIRVTFEVKKEACVTVVIGFHDTRDREVIIVEMSRAEAKKKLASCPWRSYLPIDDKIEFLKVVMEKETAIKFTEFFDIPLKYEWVEAKE